MSNAPEAALATGAPQGLGAALTNPHLSTRLAIGFVAGFLSHLIFQGAFGAALYAANLLPGLTWSLMPVEPFGVPKSINLGFWAGLWGIAYAFLEPRLTAFFGRWLGGLVYGLAPLAGYWFIVLPAKGLGIGGGFHLAKVPIEFGFHAIFGIGLAILFGFGLALARRRIRTSSDALHA
jgi:hypothetical protein